MSAAICNLALSGVAPRARIGVTEPAVHVAKHTAVQGTTIPVPSFAAMRVPHADARTLALLRMSSFLNGG
jgi:hypothetical protein